MESKEERVNKALGIEPRWAVADRAMAAWEDRAHNVHFLGRLSSHNRKTEFSLMLGHFPADTNAFVLFFHLPLRIRAGSASKPIDLFLVLPVESFESTTPFNAAPVSTSELPESHVDALKSAGLNSPLNVLRVQLRMREPGYVLMPRMKIKNELLGTPRDLLLSLRSLSQASSMTVYLKKNTYAQVALNELGSAASDHAAYTPGFRLRSMYQGRGAKQGAWELFGLTESDALLRKGNPMAAIGMEAEREGSAPPPYEEAVRTPTPSPKDPAPHTPERKPHEKQLEAPQTPDVFVKDSQSCIEETPPARTPIEKASRKRAFAEAQSPSTSDKETETRRTSKSLVRLPLFTDSTSIPGSPPLIERPHSSPPAINQPLPRHGFSIASAASPPPDDLSTDTLLREIATWLQDGWVVDANVHQKLLLPLLALGYHARWRHLRDFDLAKGRCTSQLYIRIAAQSTQADQPSVDRDIDVEEEMAHLVAWANESIFRGVESVLREETAQLGAAAARVCDSGLGAKEEYTRQKALWVASVFVCFGTSGDVEALAGRRWNVV
ncbi:hypothetical protein MPH_11275 [Macrophomina phaseolina MS6]|uniref:Uncharacterized protein n=1 Tax=Macrophomina phaseolina (strain MS6) TaxID=1126212 RepID=K2S4W0_MACPH|nr:hypothetical protein MPH_11275 [Macrophomina phaseolina MS6]